MLERKGPYWMIVCFHPKSQYANHQMDTSYPNGKCTTKSETSFQKGSDGRARAICAPTCSRRKASATEDRKRLDCFVHVQMRFGRRSRLYLRGQK